MVFALGIANAMSEQAQVFAPSRLFGKTKRGAATSARIGWLALCFEVGYGLSFSDSWGRIVKMTSEIAALFAKAADHAARFRTDTGERSQSPRHRFADLSDC